MVKTPKWNVADATVLRNILAQTPVIQTAVVADPNAIPTQNVVADGVVTNTPRHNLSKIKWEAYHKPPKPKAELVVEATPPDGVIPGTPEHELWLIKEENALLRDRVEYFGSYVERYESLAKSNKSLRCDYDTLRDDVDSLGTFEYVRKVESLRQQISNQENTLRYLLILEQMCFKFVNNPSEDNKAALCKLLTSPDKSDNATGG